MGGGVRSCDAGTEDLVEGAEPFANSWLRAIPAYPGLTLTDQQLKYGTRRILLQNLCENKPASQTYSRCGRGWTDLHHLVCGHNRGLRTFRHNALRDNLARELRKVINVVRKEVCSH